jgi:hypothetical protein
VIKREFDHMLHCCSSCFIEVKSRKDAGVDITLSLSFPWNEFTQIMSLENLKSVCGSGH